MSLAEQLILDNLQTKNPYLDLGNCGLDGTEPELQLLEQCRHLETLVLSNIHSKFEEWNKLKETERQNVIKPNKFKQIPPCLPKSLQKLILLEQGISDISFLKELPNIAYLGLGYNQISDISFFRELSNLRYLDMRSNQISDVSPLQELHGLMNLILSSNQIKYFPPEVASLGKLQGLYLADNPIENIPKEYFNKKFGNTLTEVRDYLQSIANKEDRRELNEAKLIIAGVGEVGKSELVEALSTKDYSFEAGRASTQGIQIRQWLMPCTREGKDITFRTNIWDLAGQNENYHTHQFFLTKNSVYVFVWNARVNTDEANQFEYWLGVISLLSDNAPILVVQNKIDQNEGAGTNERDWREKFPHIVGFYKTSCKTGTGIDDLRKAVQDTLLSLPNTREIWNKHRFAVREALEQRKEDYISIEQYHQLCAKHSLTDEQARFLASQLHDIGVMLYYAHDESLCDTVVLKSEWTVAAAYCLIDTQKVRAGRFQRQDLPTIWQDKRFTHKRPYLLELMKRFELIFQFQDSDTYIVPEGLPTEEPETPNPSTLPPLHLSTSYPSTPPPFLRFEYHYKFMPKGILSRLICRVHQYILGEWFWRYGVVLEDKEGNQARIVLNEVERVLKITVQGEKPTYLLRIIRHHTEAIHHNLKNPPLEEKVPCMCVECRQDKNPYLHNYATLKKFQEKGRATRECEKSAEVADIAQMLEGILDTKKGQTKILFDLIDRANVSGFFMEIERLGVSGNQIASLRKEYIHDGGNFQYADKLKVWVMDYFS